MSLHHSLRSIGARFLALLMVLSALPALAASGVDLIVKTRIPGGNNAATAITVQPDGKFVTAGYARWGTQQFSIARYNTNGSLDTTWGPAGIGYILEPLGSGNASATGVAIQSDGKVVAGGYVNTGIVEKFAIARFSAAGVLDTSFGGGGAATPVGTGNARAYGMVIQGDGKIVLAGFATDPNTGHQGFALVRYNTNATLDTTFGGTGIVIKPLGGVDSQGNAIALQADGRLVVTGTSGGALAIARFNSDGSLDTSFNAGSGFRTLGGGFTSGTAIALQGDGKIVVGGVSSGTFGFVRLNTDGTLDATFNGSGTQVVTFSQGASLTAIAIQGDGKIVGGGSATTGGGPANAATRLNSNGTVDTSFGTSGKLVSSVFGSDTPAAMALLGDGRFLLAGRTVTGSGAIDEDLVMVTAAGAIDTTFGTGGGVTEDFGSAPSQAKATLVQTDGKIVIAGTVPYELPQTNRPAQSSVVARYNSDGTLDTGFGTGGMVVNPTGATGTKGWAANAIAQQADGKLVTAGFNRVAGTTNYEIEVARYTTSGALDASFGSGGFVEISVHGVDDEATSIAIQSNGSIVVGGFTRNGTFYNSVVLRLTSSGALDTTFNSTGISEVSITTGSDQVTAIALQSDGKIVAAAWEDLSSTQTGFGVFRLNTNGTLDTGFGSSGITTTAIGPAGAYAQGLVIQGDGKIVLGGRAFNGSADEMTLARYTASGVLDTTYGNHGIAQNVLSNYTRIDALALLSSGEVAAVGELAGEYLAAQYTTSGALDTAFGSGGTLPFQANPYAGADVAYSVAIQPSDGKWIVAGNGSGILAWARLFAAGTGPAPVTPSVAVASSVNPSNSGQSVTFTATVSGSSGTPTGTVTFLDGSTAICSSVVLSSGVATCTTASLASGSQSITASYSGDATYGAATSAALTQTVQSGSTQSGQLTLSRGSIDFGGESMGTTSLPQTITITNSGHTTITISGIAASSQFAQSNNCSTLNAGASCTVTVTFTPAAAAGAINSTAAVSGSLSITSNDPASPATVALAGTAEKSMITHYYESILRREPDASGKPFWQQEAATVVSMGLDVNETWYAMAMQFFASPEYASLNRDDTGFVTDLYETFFNRAPDSSGMSFWTGQIAQGVPRDVVLVSFLFSNEFTSFSQSVFGNTTVRAEIDMVTDFYRGLLGRLPDSSGFSFWVQQFRTAQCQGSAQVTAQADAISSSFMNSGEYVNRNRTNAQFVGDMYDTFLRRGGDVNGVQFWLNQLNSGGMTREQVREQFVASQEFQTRVNAVISQGCMH